MKSMTPRFLAMVFLPAIGLVSCSHSTNRTQAQAPISVRVAAVRDGALNSHIDLAGSVLATDVVNVGAISAGRIIAMNVRVGDRVSRSQILAEVDASGYRAQLSQAQSGARAAFAQALAAGAQADAARSQLHLAEVTAERLSALYEEGAISRQDYDQSQAGLQSARAAMQQAAAGASAAVAAAGAASAGAEAAAVPVRDAYVRAPFDGVVTTRMLDVGAVVGAGAPIVTLQDTSSLELDVALPNDAGAIVRVGDTVPVHVDTLGGSAIVGQVRAVAPSDDPTLRSSTLRIAIENEPRLVSGMYARVSIPVQTNGFAIPIDALVTRAGQSGVFALERAVVRFVPVDAGATYDGFVRIDGNVQRGERVAVTGLEQLTDGAPVVVTQ